MHLGAGKYKPIDPMAGTVVPNKIMASTTTNSRTIGTFRTGGPVK
jgi:hypothetical protein